MAVRDKYMDADCGLVYKNYDNCYAKYNPIIETRVKLLEKRFAEGKDLWTGKPLSKDVLKVLSQYKKRISGV